MARKIDWQDYKRLHQMAEKTERAKFHTAVLMALYEESRLETIPSAAWIMQADQRMRLQH